MPRAPLYQVSLQLPDGTLTSKGKTIIEALQNIKPAALKSRGVFTIVYGNQTSSQLMYPLPIKQLLVNKISQQIFQKRMIAMLH